MPPEIVENPAPTAAPAPEDAFAAMFDHLSAGGDPNVEPGTLVAEAKPTAGEAAPITAAIETVAPTVDEAIPPDPNAPAAETPPAAAPAPAPAPAAAPEPAPAPVAPTPAFEVYSAEEKAQLADLQKEWPDIDKMLDLKARQLQFDTLTLAFREINRIYAPVAAYVDQTQTSDHAAAIYEGHADYDQIYAPMQKWIDEQPGYMKTAYQTVAKEGTAAEVIDMIDRFKTATGWKTPATPASAPAPAAQPVSRAAGVTELSAAAKKAAGSMRPVTAQQTAQPQGSDPNDFDAAWAEAAR